jgi:uncharacterized protein
MNFRFIFAATFSLSLLGPNVVSAGPLDDLNKALRAIDTIDKLQKRSSGSQTNNQGAASNTKTTGRQARGPSRDEWRRIQARLNELGYNAGPVDGQPGRKTRNALATFEARNGLPSDGQFDSATSRVLFNRVAVSAPVATSSGSPAPSQPVVTGQGPSFDCARASTATENAICSSGILSDLDRQLSSAYAPLKAQPGVAEAQRAWIRQRDTCGGSAVCIEQAYSTRIAVLSGTQPKPQVPQKPNEIATVSLAKAGTRTPLTQVLDAGGEAQFYGTATCGRRPVTFHLAIRNNIGGITANMTDIKRWSMSGTSKVDSMIGERVGGGKVAIVRDRRQLHGIDWLGSNIVEIDPAALTFDVGGGICEQGSLTQIDVDPPAVPGAQGKFFAVGTPREKCEVLADWLENWQSLWKDNGNDRGRNTAKLHVDALFVPVFGVPSDRLSFAAYRDMMKINGRLARDTCLKDPFLRERFRKLNTYLNSTNDRTKPYMDWYVRQQRSLASDLANKIETASDPYRLSSVSGLAPEEDIAEFLSDSDKRSLNEKIASRKSISAQSDSKAVIAELTSADPNTALERIRAYKKAPPKFTQHLHNAERATYDTSLDKIATQASTTLFGPRLLQIQFMPRTLEGLREADALLDETPFKLVRKDFADIEPLSELNKELAERQAEVIEALNAEIDGFASSKAGLVQSLAWFETLDGRVNGAIVASDIARVKSAWDKKREAQLAEALPAFEQEVLTASDVDKLFAEFVSDEHDSTRPVVLEYELVRALSQ